MPLNSVPCKSPATAVWHRHRRPSDTSAAVHSRRSCDERHGSVAAFLWRSGEQSKAESLRGGSARKEAASSWKPHGAAVRLPPPRRYMESAVDGVGGMCLHLEGSSVVRSGDDRGRTYRCPSSGRGEYRKR